MSSRETADFTQAMINSGITYNLDGVEGLKADKHSTGGVGDKTSLIYSPLVASFGVKVAKLSGRGLGQTAAITLIQNGTFKNLADAKVALEAKLKSGEAAHYLKDFIEAQHGEFSKIENYEKHFTTKYKIEIKSQNDGYVKFRSADSLGFLSLRLGAGRETKADKIDFAAGIYLNKSSNEFVKKGEVVMTLFTNIDKEKNFTQEAIESFELLKKPNEEKIILDILSDIKIA
ncbi:hypothetical protein FQR65_LT16624 [Abscondita terminalis]|nr:hypothetical protein FQR65_LT16624 [Abscondita terminalis]